MQEQLGLGVIPGAGWRAAEIGQIAREAEEAGFTALFAAEVNNDVLATVQLMGQATQRLRSAAGSPTSTFGTPMSAPKPPRRSRMRLAGA